MILHLSSYDIFQIYIYTFLNDAIVKGKFLNKYSGKIIQ